ICGQVLFVDGKRLGFQVLRLLHALQGPEEVDRGRPAFREQLEGLRRAFRKHYAEGGGTADGRRAAHHHVADRLRDLGRRAACDVSRVSRKQALVEKLEPVAFPADWFDGHYTRRSLPPSTGTCAAVVLAKGGPHISAASSATSFELTSVSRRLFFLYCSTVR